MSLEVEYEIDGELVLCYLVPDRKRFKIVRKDNDEVVGHIDVRDMVMSLPPNIIKNVCEKLKQIAANN